MLNVVAESEETRLFFFSSHGTKDNTLKKEKLKKKLLTGEVKAGKMEFL